jgi:DNA-binding CsgD family transcriptional regulator
VSGKLQPKNTITLREQEIIDLIMQGMINKEIGRALNISEETVKRHNANIFDKIGCSTRLELTVMILARNTIPLAEHEAVTTQLKNRVRSLENQILWGGWSG